MYIYIYNSSHLMNPFDSDGIAASQEVKSAGNFKVCVCGGAGGIGQPLSMLMALDPNVKEHPAPHQHPCFFR